MIRDTLKSSSDLKEVEGCGPEPCKVMVLPAQRPEGVRGESELRQHGGVCVW